MLRYTALTWVGLRGSGTIRDTQIGEAIMRMGNFRTAILLYFFLLGSQSASAASVSGSSALAIASLVAASSPVVRLYNKNVMARLFDGRFNLVVPPDTTISIEADAIVCSAGDVDITAHSCTLTFGPPASPYLIGPAISYLTGRKAHELYATMMEAMIPPQGTAGALDESLSHLVCTINPHEIAKKSGGGADCTFDAGPSPAAKAK